MRVRPDCRISCGYRTVVVFRKQLNGNVFELHGRARLMPSKQKHVSLFSASTVSFCAQMPVSRTSRVHSRAAACVPPRPSPFEQKRSNLPTLDQFFSSTSAHLLLSHVHLSSTARPRLDCLHSSARLGPFKPEFVS